MLKETTANKLATTDVVKNNPSKWFDGDTIKMTDHTTINMKLHEESWFRFLEEEDDAFREKTMQFFSIF